MAKKIRGIKLKGSDINKNSGKEISHTINKIKENEARYTFYLVIIFMVSIVIGICLCFRVSTYIIGDYQDVPSVSYSNTLIELNNDQILNDEDGLLLEDSVLKFTNNTSENVNYIIKIVNDERKIKECKCNETLANFENLRYSVNGGEVKTFTDSDMIIKSGMINSKESDKVTIKIWFDESMKKTIEHNFFGRVVLEQLEDMDKEDN